MGSKNAPSVSATIFAEIERDIVAASFSILVSIVAVAYLFFFAPSVAVTQ